VTSTRIPLDDIGLFRKRRSHEQMSQRERAEQIRDQFAECMDNARTNGCVMPMLCAFGDPDLRCVHLHVDYANFTGAGIPLTRRARATFDARLRAIGTQVYRSVSGQLGPLPGDVHLPALQKISTFTGGPRKAAARPAKGKPRRAAPKKSGGWLSRLFG
jgi:hypothetical protein